MINDNVSGNTFLIPNYALKHKLRSAFIKNGDGNYITSTSKKLIRLTHSQLSNKEEIEIVELEFIKAFVI